MEPEFSAAERQLAADLAAFWAPPEQLTVTEWADSNRMLSTKSSAQRGEWVTRPYQREPMDVFTDPRVHTVVLMVSRQTLKSEDILNKIGYAIDRDPGPILVVLPRDSDCRKFSKIRLMPMIEGTPCLKQKVSGSKSRASGNTLDYKDFDGGHLSIVASGSPGNLAALPIRYLFCDEIDKYPASAGAAGDPISLAQGRQEEFWNRRTVLACTPTVQGLSRIEAAWLDSDQREYEFCCPHCGAYQIPSWRTQVRWDSSLPRNKQAESARYHCAGCDAAWNDVERWDASNRGRFRATAPFNGIAGFRVSGLCRIGGILADMVDEWLRASRNQEALKTFINEQLAELWAQPGEALEWRRLVERREVYSAGTVPAGGLLLTAGVDVQRADGGRLECEIVAWGENRETWSVDYRILYGDPSEPEVWKKLEKLLHETFPCEGGGELGIDRMFVDSGDGTTTAAVYDWVQKQPRQRVYAIKGYRQAEQPVSGPKAVEIKRNGRANKYGPIFRVVGVDFFKGILYADLKKAAPTPDELAAGAGFPAGFCHFPLDTAYGDEHFKEVCSEQLVTRRDRKGREITEYQQIRPNNHALDVRIYAMAAGWDSGVHKKKASDWAYLRKELAVSAARSNGVVEEIAPATLIAPKPKYSEDWGV